MYGIWTWHIGWQLHYYYFHFLDTVSKKNHKTFNRNLQFNSPYRSWLLVIIYMVSPQQSSCVSRMFLRWLMDTLVRQHLCVWVSVIKPELPPESFSQWFTNSAYLWTLYWNQNKSYFLDLPEVAWLVNKNRTSLQYLWALLSSMAGISPSCQARDIYPSQNVSSTQFYRQLQGNYGPFFRHELPCCLGTSCLYLLIKLSESQSCHCTNRFPGNQSHQVRVGIVRREEGGGRREKSSFRMFIHGHFP